VSGAILSCLRVAARAARLHGRRAAELLEAGRPASAQSSMAKLSVAELMQRVAAFALEVLGPEGLIEDGIGSLRGRVAAFQRASVATTISGGAAEIQRAVIARRELGCPRG
jgi:3-oxocholest-4-en-26-oyl-CoA dehydrogenase alpha subunit